MEGKPGGQQPESAEAPVSRAAVVEGLRASPEDRTLFDRYVAERMREVERLNAPRADLELTVELAELCRDAGLFAEAVELFEIGMMQAEQRDEFEDLETLCRTQLERLSGGYSLF